MKTPAMQSEIRKPKSLKQKVLAFTFLTLFFSTGGASAAVITWLDSSFPGSFIASYFSELNQNFGGGYVLEGAEASALGSHTLLDGAASATFTNTISGFSVGGTGDGTHIEAYRLFEVSGLADGETVTGEFSFSLPGFNMFGSFSKWDPNLQGGSWVQSPFFTTGPATVDLSNGTHAVFFAVASDTTEPTFMGNGETFASFNVVPEPGSAMLCLVAMGLGLRRKRSGVSVRANSHGDSAPMML